MLTLGASQLGIDPTLFGDYAHRAKTRREHLAELQQCLHVRSFRVADWRACLQAGTNAAWATDRGEPIVQAMLAHLRPEALLSLPLRCWSVSGLPRGCARGGESSGPWRRI
jgi:hypothetical protein